MRRTVVSFVIAALVSTVVLADEQIVIPKEAPGKPDFKRARSGSYVMDPAHSQVLFTVSHLGLTHYTGQFTQPSGTLELDAANVAKSKVEVSIDIAKVRTTVADLDTELSGPKFFDTASHPSATFVSTRVTPADAGRMTIVGDLTIKGITHPVTLQARFVGAGNEFWGEKKDAIGFTATGRIKRSDFGLVVVMGEDDVDLVINAGFEAK